MLSSRRFFPDSALARPGAVDQMLHHLFSRLLARELGQRHHGAKHFPHIGHGRGRKLWNKKVALCP